MPAKRSVARTTKPAARARAEVDTVDALLATLVHPRKQEIVALRDAILAAHPSIRDGVKWNAPSFRTTEWFATIHMRATTGVQVILHLGARRTAASADGFALDDPRGLLQWLAKDRATIVFADMADLESKRPAFQRLLRDWITHVA
ncbi:MAG TPA: DUF1801 domain-containing protein [Gemmatimonadaceae bacterium]|nr:DUF1801 domain-containing protein [Gemmatimonadaceae bacterium]